MRVIVPVGAGGANDTSTRLIAQKLSESLRQNFYVENIVGAGGNIGMGQAMKTAPDGYTVLSVAPSFVINPTLNPKTPFDPVKDFAPVTLMCATPTVIVCPRVPEGARTVKELIALLQASPGKFSYSSAGTGTPAHLAGELFKAAYGVDIIHVPFTGGGPAMNSTVGGHTPVSFPALSTAAPSILGGKVRRARGDEPARRSHDAARTCRRMVKSRATAIEQAEHLCRVLLPANAPRPVIDLLHREIVKALALAGREGEAGRRSASTRSAIRPTSSPPGSRPRSPSGPRSSRDAKIKMP